MLKDLTFYGLLAALLVTVEAPQWILIIPAAAAISAITRRIQRGA